MSDKEFQIEFFYQDIAYIGLVSPLGKKNWYAINLESENQESFIEIVAQPSESELEDWTFTCLDGEDAMSYYDKDLLTEIGEAMERVLANKSTERPESQIG